MRGQVSVLCFPRKDCRSRRKTGAVCTQGSPEPQPQAGGAWKEEETSRTVTLCPGALGNQTLLSGWRSMCFSCFSHTCSGIKIKQRVKRMDSEAIHSSHKWRKIALSDFSPIWFTDEQLFTAPSLSTHSNCYNFHAHGSCPCSGVLPAPSVSGLKSLDLPLLVVKKSAKTSIKNPNYSFLADSHHLMDNIHQFQ